MGKMWNTPCDDSLIEYAEYVQARKKHLQAGTQIYPPYFQKESGEL